MVKANGLHGGCGWLVRAGRWSVSHRSYGAWLSAKPPGGPMRPAASRPGNAGAGHEAELGSSISPELTVNPGRSVGPRDAAAPPDGASAATGPSTAVLARGALPARRSTSTMADSGSPPRAAHPAPTSLRQPALALDAFSTPQPAPVSPTRQLPDRLLTHRPSLSLSLSD
jgi:hypothetical protein